MTDARRRRTGEALGFWLLLAPSLLLLVLVFARTVACVVRMSFNGWTPPSFYVEDVVLDHYVRLATDPLIREAAFNTVVLAFQAALTSVVLAYVMTLIVWLRPKRFRLTVIGLMLCPLLASEISIIFGWWLVLPRNGLLSYMLVGSGLVSEKINLLYTEFAAFLGLVYAILPYSFFILLSVIDRQDRLLIEASADLGASPLSTFREVVLPLTWRGVVLAFSQALIWAFGIYATPSALGPDTLWTMGQRIQEEMIGRANWPLASAIAVAMIAAIALLLVVMRTMEPKERTA